MRFLIPLLLTLMTSATLAGGADPASDHPRHQEPAGEATPPRLIADLEPQATAAQQSPPWARIPRLTAEDPALVPYHAVYTTRYNRFTIEANRRLEATESGWRIVTRARNFLGRIHEEENFHLDGQGRLIPETYVFDRSIMGISRKESLEVDSDDGTAHSERRSRDTSLDFSPGMLGPLSYQVAMAHDLARGEERLTYSVLHRGRLREYEYQVLGEVEMETPMGTLSTLKVERVREDDDRETLLWLAPSLNFMPVRLVQHEDGETYEMNIKSFTLGP